MLGRKILPLIKASGKTDRFSENLMKWVTKHRSLPLFVAYSPISYVDGKHMGEFSPLKTCATSLYVGVGDLDKGWLHGSRLSEILCSGVKAEEWAYPPKYVFQLLPDWWQRYIADGKCCIDPEHWLYADQERWDEAVDGKTRRCLWCGNYHEYLHIEMVEKTSWRQVPQA